MYCAHGESLLGIAVQRPCGLLHKEFERQLSLPSSAFTDGKAYLATSMHQLLLSLGFVALATATPCPLPGPVYPPPKNLARSGNFRDALTNLTTILDAAVIGLGNPSFLANETSFSMILTDADQQLWEYHHTALTRSNGTTSVDSGSQYRIGSVSKVLTNLVLLRLGLDLEEKITKWIPELNEGKGAVGWDRVTLKDLGSHTSGVQRDYGWENYDLMAQLQAAGFRRLGRTNLLCAKW
jgi:CubicO group peptidase (beta-lactamase class C family)